jgi:hypothetical protein
MVIRSAKERGALMVELLVAMALLTGALLPLAYSVASEKRYSRSLYQHAVAMEIVDGEMEALLAGQWKAFSNGTSEYPVRAEARVNLPPGRFLLSVKGQHLRLEWRPALKQSGGPVIREAEAK